MTVVLISSNATTTLGCKPLADALRAWARPASQSANWRRRTSAPSLPDLEVDLPIGPMEFLNTPLLQDATAIGLFIGTGELNQFARVYRQLCKLQNSRPAPLFTGPPFPWWAMLWSPT